MLNLAQQASSDDGKTAACSGASGTDASARPAEGARGDRQTVVADAKAHSALREAGLTCSVATYQSLSQHLQAARAMQRLTLPEVAAPGHKGNTPAASKLGNQLQQQQQQHDDTDVQRDGSLAHLLGVTPESLRQAHCLPRAAAQRAHAGCAKEVEGRLAALAEAMAAAVMGDGAAGDASAAAQAVQSVRDTLAAVEAAESENDQLLTQHMQLCGSYLELLSGIHNVLLQLVEGCMVGKQARLDEEHCRWLVSHVRTLHRCESDSALGVCGGPCAWSRLSPTLADCHLLTPMLHHSHHHHHHQQPPTASCACCSLSCTLPPTPLRASPHCAPSQPRLIRRRQRRAPPSNRWVGEGFVLISV